MLLSVSRPLFSEHLQIAAKAVPSRAAFSILEGILLEKRGGMITVTAANLELIISTSFPHDGTEQFKVVLPVKLAEIVRKMSGDFVRLSFDAETFVLTMESSSSEIGGSDSKIQLFGLDPQDFPAGPVPTPPLLSFCIEPSELRKSLRQVLFAVSHDESKPAFTGVNFALKDEAMSISSSDTFRMADTVCRVQKIFGGEARFLAPGRLMQECARLFGEEGGKAGTEAQELRFSLLENRLLLESGGIKIISRLLEENFPEVERVMPVKFAGTAYLSTRELASAIERAALLSDKGSPVLRFSLGQDEAGDCLLIRNSSRFGKVRERVTARLEGDGLEIYLNSKFLQEMLRVCEGEEVILKHTGPNRGCVLKDTLYEEFRYFLLPVKN